MRCLVRTVPWNEERYAWAKQLVSQLPNGELVEDTNHNGYDTFLDALERQGTEDDVWHFEDDAVLTSGWERKARGAVFLSPKNILVQGYNHLPNVETGLRSPGSFWWTLCFRLPGTWAPDLLAYARTWDPQEAGFKKATKRGDWDLMVRSYMRDRGLQYWLLVPGLVNHRDAHSTIHPSRSRQRQSPTFVP